MKNFTSAKLTMAGVWNRSMDQYYELSTTEQDYVMKTM